jgi:FkbH-like protein
MDNKKLFSICASSNLLEANSCWDELKENYDLSFDSYGEFTMSLMKNINSGIVLVIFLEDLIADSEDNFILLKDRYASFFQELENRASSSVKPIVLCWGKNNNQNIISISKKDSTLEEFYKWFSEKLSILKKRFETIYLIDLNEIFYPFGSNEIFSDRNWYFAHCRLSIQGLKVLTDALLVVTNRLFSAPSKVLVLDCDNTLWGGVVGEDGVEGIVLGQDGIGTAYVDFQKEIVRLTNNGAIVVLASKNNDKDVWDVFDQHSEMKLKRDHIVTSKINWNEKAFNVQEIAKELDLGLDSFVFWDDNPLERDKMKTLLPQVQTIDVPEEVIKWPRLLRTLSSFAKFKITEEDKKKSDQYKSRAKFNNDLKSTNDIKSYLTSLNLSPEILSVNDSNISRAEQLCMKTNQFNVRNKRHSANDLKKLKLDNDDFVFLIRMRDLYGDHGIVSLVCLTKIKDDFLFLDTFLMSCRVLGRHLEAWILSEIVKKIKKNKARYLIAEFVDTKRNTIALQFLNEYGFVEISKENKIFQALNAKIFETKSTIYCLDTKNLDIPNIEIYDKEKK